VYIAENLKPGLAKPIRIMSENFTVYRGESGDPHIVAFRKQRIPETGQKQNQALSLLKSRT
jgi:hypothetical protein